jgi:cobalt/nickel transport system ATP-binding protein
MGRVEILDARQASVSGAHVTALSSKSLFEARDLCYDYPGKIPALRQVSFQIDRGEIVALVGANGSGKSTLLKLLDGLIFPISGELFAFGQKLSEKLLKDNRFNADLRREVGLVFQDPDIQLFSSSVWDEVIFGPLQLGISKTEIISRANETLDLLNISNLKERPPYLLSGGEKRKVALASVLALGPNVLLLDEPTSGLDPRSQGGLIDFLLTWVNQDRCLVFSTQDLDLAEEIAKRIIVMGTDHSIIADGKPEELLSDSDFLLRTNLIHEHSHRHKDLVHCHQHQHQHQHGK